MTVATLPHLAPALQDLVNLRLDTLDRVLLDNVPRLDRVSIVAEVESQIFELLHERGTDELTRDDVLAVLTRLDPPEAYVPVQAAQTRASAGGERFTTLHSTRPRPLNEQRIGTVGGVTGISALGMVVLIPLIYLLAALFNSEGVLMLGLLLTVGLMSVGGFVAMVLSLCARLRGGLCVAGAVTGALALLLSFSVGTFLWMATNSIATTPGGPAGS
jgi:hypothetical protein